MFRGNVNYLIFFLGDTCIFHYWMMYFCNYLVFTHEMYRCTTICALTTSQLGADRTDPVSDASINAVHLCDVLDELAIAGKGTI